MNALEDIEALLEDAEDQIATADELHDKALSTEAFRNRFKTRVKNVLENQRSALDYVAVEITTKCGSPSGLVYYPLAESERQFRSEMDRKMPDVASSQPTIADAIKRYQPYEERNEWLRELSQLTREQKHKRLSFQLVREVYQCHVTEKSTGTVVRWFGVRFLPGRIEATGPPNGVMEVQPGPGLERAAPGFFKLGGPTGFLVFGVPIDPLTQRPYPDDRLIVRGGGPIELWCFLRPHAPVLDQLRKMQEGVRLAIADIAQSAGL